MRYRGLLLAQSGGSMLSVGLSRAGTNEAREYVSMKNYFADSG